MSGCQIKDLRAEVIFVAVAHKHKQVFGGIQWRKCAFYKIKEQQRLLRLQKITAVVDIRCLLYTSVDGIGIDHVLSENHINFARILALEKGEIDMIFGKNTGHREN